MLTSAHCLVSRARLCGRMVCPGLPRCYCRCLPWLCGRLFMLGSVAGAYLGTLSGVMPALAGIMPSILARLCGRMVYPGLSRYYCWCLPRLCGRLFVLGSVAGCSCSALWPVLTSALWPVSCPQYPVSCPRFWLGSVAEWSTPGCLGAIAVVSLGSVAGCSCSALRPMLTSARWPVSCPHWPVSCPRFFDQSIVSLTGRSVSALRPVAIAAFGSVADCSYSPLWPVLTSAHWPVSFPHWPVSCSRFFDQSIRLGLRPVAIPALGSWAGFKGSALWPDGLSPAASVLLPVSPSAL